MKYADLHAHTVESDGTYTPIQLVREAIARGLSAVSIVDHDTVGAIAEALEEAQETSLEVIPGIELTSQYDRQEIHILGYFLDYQNKKLRDKLQLVQQDRIGRVYKIVANLKELGLELNPKTGVIFLINVILQLKFQKVVLKLTLLFETGEQIIYAHL